MATFYDKIKEESRLYLDSLTQEDETLQMNLRNFLVDNRKQLMVVESVISYQTVKDILKNLPNLGTKIKSKYGDPMCLTWEQCEKIMRTSKMLLILPKVIILDYNKTEFGNDESELLKTLLNSDSVESSTTVKILVVLSAATKELRNSIESFLGETYVNLEHSKQKLDLKHRDEVQKANSIVEAASLGNCYQVMRFIDNDNDINMKDSDHNTALHKAAETANTKIALFLLKHGAAQLLNGHKRSPLHLACVNGSDDIVSILIEYGANLEQEDSCKNTPLTCASTNGHANVVKTLLQYGAKIDGINSNREASLHIAARTNDLDAVKILIKNGANRNFLNNQKQTAEQMALEKGFQQIADYLREEPQEGEHKELVKSQ